MVTHKYLINKRYYYEDQEIASLFDRYDEFHGNEGVKAVPALNIERFKDVFEGFLEANKMTKMSSVKYLLPLNIGGMEGSGQHWVGLIVDVAGHNQIKITYLDSLNANAKVPNIVTNQLKEIFGVSHIPINKNEGVWTQGTSVACGAYVYENLVRFGYGVGFNDVNPGEDSVRKKHIDILGEDFARKQHYNHVVANRDYNAVNVSAESLYKETENILRKENITKVKSLCDDVVSSFAKNEQERRRKVNLLVAKVYDKAASGRDELGPLFPIVEDGKAFDSAMEIAKEEMTRIEKDSYAGNPAGKIYKGVGVHGKLSAEGFVVDEVFKGTPAARLGLKSGDVIKSVGGKDLSKMLNLKEVAAQIRSAGGKEHFKFIIQRGSSQIEVGEGQNERPCLINKKYKTTQNYEKLFNIKEKWTSENSNSSAQKPEHKKTDEKFFFKMKNMQDEKLGKHVSALLTTSHRKNSSGREL